MTGSAALAGSSSTSMAPPLQRRSDSGFVESSTGGSLAMTGSGTSTGLGPSTVSPAASSGTKTSATKTGSNLSEPAAGIVAAGDIGRSFRDDRVGGAAFGDRGVAAQRISADAGVESRKSFSVVGNDDRLFGDHRRTVDAAAMRQGPKPGERPFPAGMRRNNDISLESTGSCPRGTRA